MKSLVKLDKNSNTPQVSLGKKFKIRLRFSLEKNIKIRIKFFVGISMKIGHSFFL